MKPTSKEVKKSFDEFYYYFNWPAGQDNKIHYADCKKCLHGKGNHREKIPGRNGVWIGPFRFIDDTINTIQNRFNKRLPKIPFCTICFKGKDMVAAMEIFNNQNFKTKSKTK